MTHIPGATNSQLIIAPANSEYELRCNIDSVLSKSSHAKEKIDTWMSDVYQDDSASQLDGDLVLDVNPSINPIHETIIKYAFLMRFVVESSLEDNAINKEIKDEIFVQGIDSCMQALSFNDLSFHDHLIVCATCVLHDIGKLNMDENEIRNDVTGSIHSEKGMLIAQSLELPSLIRMGIAFHNVPFSFPVKHAPRIIRDIVIRVAIANLQTQRMNGLTNVDSFHPEWASLYKDLIDSSGIF